MTCVLVCGGRDYADYAAVLREMGKLHAMFNFEAVVHGAARGADSLAGRWARQYHVAEIACPADWNGPFKRRAGFRRNQSMLTDHKPDIAVAFPGGNGTADMIRRCQKANVPVFCVPLG